MTRGEIAARTWVALVHHPVYDRQRRVVTTAITNLDIHDIARSARTFGLAGYFVVTPIAAQRALAERIVGHWQSELREAAAETREERGAEFRGHALALVEVVASIEAAMARVEEASGGCAPLLVGTSARDHMQGQAISAHGLLDVLAEKERPAILLLGTGWGLADEVLDRVNHLLTPIRGCSDYNHLSVRSAAAILLDRLFGDRAGGPAAS